MRVLLLSDINSSHTRQWAISLAEQGVKIGLFSLRKNDGDWTKDHPDIKVLYAEDQARYKYLGFLNNFDLFTYRKKINKAVGQFQPDILHAHNVGNHGLIAALANKHPLIVSAWGSDITAHPKKSFFHDRLVRYTLQKADILLATSHNLARETQKYTTKTVGSTPFGIDMKLFAPSQKARKIFTSNEIVLGSVKGLKKVYNHHFSIKHFATLVNKYPDLALRFLFVGEGNQKETLQKFAADLGVSALITFAGAIRHQDVPAYLAEIDILLNLSSREGFGVAVLEASAMQIPVIASDAGGLPEVIEDRETGFLHPLKDETGIVKSLEILVLNSGTRRKMGEKGRAFVEQHYSKNKCTLRMLRIYQDILKTSKEVR